MSESTTSTPPPAPQSISAANSEPNDPAIWREYQGFETPQSQSNGKGHGKGHEGDHGKGKAKGHDNPGHPHYYDFPVVPEPSTYGLILAAFCLVTLIYAKRRAAKKLGITCGRGGCGKDHHHK